MEKIALFSICSDKGYMCKSVSPETCQGKGFLQAEKKGFIVTAEVWDLIQQKKNQGFEEKMFWI